VWFIGDGQPRDARLAANAHELRQRCCLMGMAIGCPARREEKVLEEHVAHCIAYAIVSGDKADQRRTVAKLMAVIEGSDW